MIRWYSWGIVVTPLEGTARHLLIDDCEGTQVPRGTQILPHTRTYKPKRGILFSDAVKLVTTLAATRSGFVLLRLQHCQQPMVHRCVPLSALHT